MAGIKGGGAVAAEAIEDEDEYLEVVEVNIPGGIELPRANELSRETDFILKHRSVNDVLMSSFSCSVASSRLLYRFSFGRAGWLLLLVTCCFCRETCEK